MTETDGRTAVWTGSGMIFGGEAEAEVIQRPNGGRHYNPTSDSWRELSPSQISGVSHHTLSAGEMIAGRRGRKRRRCL